MNPSNDYLDRIRHIKEEIDYLITTSDGLTYERFYEDETIKRAFVRSLEIIGEAVKTIPAEILQKYTEIKWNNIAGMRDKLIHHYFGVDYELVWDVVENHLYRLKKVINSIIAEE